MCEREGASGFSRRAMVLLRSLQTEILLDDLSDPHVDRKRTRVRTGLERCRAQSKDRAESRRLSKDINVVARCDSGNECLSRGLARRMQRGQQGLRCRYLTFGTVRLLSK